MCENNLAIALSSIKNCDYYRLFNYTNFLFLCSPSIPCLYLDAKRNLLANIKTSGKVGNPLMNGVSGCPKRERSLGKAVILSLDKAALGWCVCFFSFFIIPILKGADPQCLQ